jgi:ectoine hydroxylase-related dioxygenase (phytanoyl-CoA dioxygenase family)
MSLLTEQWQRDGYVIVPNLLSAREVASMRQLCDDILAQWRERDPQTGVKPSGEEVCMRHLNHSAYFAQTPEKLETLMALVADPRVLAAARCLTGDEPMFRTTSYFINPLLTQRDGNWHRDSQFSHPDPAEEREVLLAEASKFPSEAGVQMQIALAPSDDIEVVPGSHLRWDTAEEFAIRRADGGRNATSGGMPGAVRVRMEAGDMAAFNPYGLHRGRYHLNRLRRTLMLTYTAASRPCADHFSHQPWFLEPGYMESLSPATRTYFEPFIATYRAGWQEAGSAQEG